MSHNYLFRPPAADSDRRPDRGQHASPDRRQGLLGRRRGSPDRKHVSPDRRHASPDRRQGTSGRRRGSPDRQHASPDRRQGSSDRRYSSSDRSRDFPGPPLESLSVSHPPTSFSSRGAQLAQDGALGILNSCGLEPADLALLAELPEDVLTVESLPQVLQQIKGKRGTGKPHLSGSRPPSYSSSSSYTPSSTRRSSVKPTAGEWDQPHSQPAQFPPEEVTHGPLSPELDRWGNHSPGSSFRKQPPSLLSLVVDYNYRPGPSDNGKTAGNASPVFSQDYNHRSGRSDHSHSGPVSSQDYNHRPGSSDYGKTGRAATLVSSQDYIQRPQPSIYGQTGRDAGPVFSQDFNCGPGSSDYDKMGRDAGPVSSRDYDHRPGSSDYGKTGRDAGPVSSLDYNPTLGLSDYGKTSRDVSPLSFSGYNQRRGLSDYGQTGRDVGPVTSLEYNQRPGLSDYGRDVGPVTSFDYNYGPGLSDYGKRCRDADPVSSVDYNKTPGLSGYGKTGRDSVPALSQPHFSSAGGTKRTRRSRFSQLEAVDHMAVPPPEEHYPTTLRQRGEPEISSIRSSSCGRLAIAAGAATAGLLPCKKEAVDFHGTSPPGFPYSCSLCDITVMSDKVWIKHINGPQHADGQLNLLQKFPNWDCRMETISRPDQLEKKKDEGTPQQPQTANQSASIPPQNQKKSSGKGKVVCVRFPAQSVDEAYLRKLAEPFGKIVTVLMFPSLAFVELGSVDQAKDLVKFYTGCPPAVNGQNLEFRISSTFNFLQSSRVVSFSPAPVGEESLSDLMTIIKRFGSPLYTLFLPSKAFVEMKNTPDAQKMVDFYSSKALMVNNESIKVSFSVEYKSLMRVTAAERYDEETSSSKRTQSSSSENEDKTKIKRSRKRSEEGEKERKGEGEKSSRKERTRSRSRDKSGDKSIQEKSRKDGRSRSRGKSGDKSRKDGAREKSSKEEKSSRDETTRTRSKSKEKSTKEKSPRTKSVSRDKSMEKSSRAGRSRSTGKSRKDEDSRPPKSNSGEKSTGDKSTRCRETRAREESSSKSSGQSLSAGELVVPEKTTDCEGRTCPGPSPDPDPVNDSKPKAEEATEEENGSSAEESDIEGMEVIGEDGESLEDEDEEGDNCPAEGTDLTKEDNEKVMEIKKEAADQEEVMAMKKEEADDQQQVMQLKEEETEEERQLTKVREEQQQEEAMENEEEESDFPIDLENCITLDELGEDQSDEQDEGVPDESNTSRVVYFNNLPPFPFDDADFVKLVKDFGTAVKFYRVRGRRAGFIEMSTSSEALRVVEEMSSKSVTVHGFRVYANISDRHKRLTNGLSPEWKGDGEKGSSSSKKRRRSERLSIDQSKERKSEGREESLKTPEKESTSKEKTQKKESTSKKTPEEASSTSKKTPEEASSTSQKTPEEASLTFQKTPEEASSTSKKTPEEESSTSKKTPEEASSTSKKTPEEASSTSKKTPEEASSTSKKTPEEESSTSKKTPEEASSTSKKTPEEASSTSKKTPEEASLTSKKTPEEEELLSSTTTSKKMSEKFLSNENSQKASINKNTSGRDLKQTDEKNSNEESAAKIVSAKESLSKTSPENKTLKRKGTCENDSVPEKKEKKNESANDEKKRLLIHMVEGAIERTPATDESSEGQGEESELGLKKSPDRPDSGGSPPKPQTDQEAAVDGLQDSETALHEQQQSGSVGGAAERQDPTGPVGTEFVRPVVGYFCNLCQLIYADEDEAKLQHCSTLTHYRKYQEKTGKDPWAS